ncbi:MAG TPA: helical backbone metal receptor [Ottowia sp.]|uniref:ABC transporter substrate-binding protein n=1 Tax=Ottowia sp. TaxID=1898956 RepID=UPI0011D3A430|nr:helical backbone metal receptor [Ottowia sp.]TXI14286.1 MAG: ABC transporter substrate-binding protein [Ottowia sp.]HNE61040.1 helical backbone metal receptor [Ottowia sp.]HNR83755.1 helical backbone metal receptor [Ottowia sp.]HNT83691.1 helical backbone metal receptor [Ottowia sp.]HOZ92966.1 helical backbone metal receptor [Ottowia sp.]
MSRWLLALLAWVWVGLVSAQELRDDAGQPLRLDAAPRRIVSLLPSLTETVCALGACERLVGVDRYSNWPASVQTLPQVGGGLDPNIEAVVALKPDLVLIGTSSRAALRLRALGLNVLALEPRTRAELRRVTQRLGTALRLDGADALARRIDDGVAAAAAALPVAARGQRVYYEITPAPHAAGQGSFIHELLLALGLVNVIDDPALGPFPRLNPELVVRADPDLIMVSQGGAADMARRPGWAGLRALREGRVCEFNAAQRDILVRPGPRMPEAARLMADCAARRPLQNR